MPDFTDALIRAWDTKVMIISVLAGTFAARFVFTYLAITVMLRCFYQPCDLSEISLAKNSSFSCPGSCTRPWSAMFHHGF